MGAGADDRLFKREAVDDDVKKAANDGPEDGGGGGIKPRELGGEGGSAS